MGIKTIRLNTVINAIPKSPRSHTKGMSYRRLLDEYLAASSLEIQPVLELGRTDLICNLVEQGNGISFLPEYVIRDHLESGRLVILPVEDIDIRV